MKYIKLFIAAVLALTMTACSDTNTAEVTDMTTEQTDTVSVPEISNAATTESEYVTDIEVIENNAADTETTAEVDTQSKAEETTAQESKQIVGFYVLTEEAVVERHVDYRTLEEVQDLLTVLTDEELKAFLPDEASTKQFMQVAQGRDGGPFRDVTLRQIADASADREKYYKADCDIVFDYEGYEGIPVAVYYSKPKFLVYDWSVETAYAFGYDAEKIKAFCESEDYSVIKTASAEDVREILRNHGGDPRNWG